MAEEHRPLLSGRDTPAAQRGRRLVALAGSALLAAAVVAVGLRAARHAGGADPAVLVGQSSAVWAGEPMGPEVGSLADAMDRLNHRLGALQSGTAAAATQEKKFSSEAAGDLGAAQRESQRSLQDLRWEAAFLAHPGPVCLLYTSPSPRDQRGSRMPSSA